MSFRVLGAAALIGLALGVGTDACAATWPPPETRVWRAQIDDSLAAGMTGGARVPADRFGEAMSAAPRKRRLEAAAQLDTLALAFFSTGTPEGFDQAGALLQRALTLREQALGPNGPEVAATLASIATLDDYAGRWTEAVPVARRALDIRRARLGVNDPRTAASERQLGVLLLQLGQPAAAESLIAHATHTFESHGDAYRPQVAEGCNLLGEINRMLDREAEAEREFERGLEVAARDSTGDQTTRITLLNNLAGLYKDQGLYARAEPLLDQVVEGRERARPRDAGLIAAAHLNLAEIYRLQDRLEEAEPLYTQALAEAREALGPDHPDLVLFLNQAAVCDRELGRDDQADSLFLESQHLLVATLGDEHPLVAQNLSDQGLLAEARARFADALRLHRDALAIREDALGNDHPETASSRVDIARCLIEQPGGGDSAAAPLLARALSVLNVSRVQPEARVEAIALTAGIAARAGQLPLAIAGMRRALAAADSLRAVLGGGDASRARFMDRQRGRVDDLIGWQIANHDPRGALESHERARARVLLDQLSAAGVDLAAGVAPAMRDPLQATERAARVRLGRLQRELEAVQMDGTLTEADRLRQSWQLRAGRDSAAWDLMRARERLKEASPLWQQVLSSNGRTPSFAELQADDTPRGGAMLVYHLGQHASWLWVVPPAPQAPRTYALTLGTADARTLGVPSGPASAEAIELAISGARAPGRPRMRAALAQWLAMPPDQRVVPPAPGAAAGADPLLSRLEALGNALLPASERAALGKASELVVIPDGALHLLPLEALVLGRDRKGAPRYWLDERAPLRYAASATALRNLSRRTRAAVMAESVLSVCDPAVAPGAAGAAGSSWSRLPATVEESARLSRALAGDGVITLAGAEASETNVRREIPGKRIVHLATHGFVVEERTGMLAGLVLAAPDSAVTDASRDGLLQLFEIYELPLACDLAILSGCGTGSGARVAGEGVYAIARGFLTAGAQRVVASLWAVSDVSTAELIGGFAQGLAGRTKPGASLPAGACGPALRDARRTLRNSAHWRDPFYWAPFVLSGTE